MRSRIAPRASVPFATDPTWADSAAASPTFAAVAAVYRRGLTVGSRGIRPDPSPWIDAAISTILKAARAELAAAAGQTPQRILICPTPGGFCLSEEAIRLGRTISKDDTWGGFVLPSEDHPVLGGKGLRRDDPVLLEVFHRLGDRCRRDGNDLMVVQIPAGVEWDVVSRDSDGSEEVVERHRRWPSVTPDMYR